MKLCQTSRQVISVNCCTFGSILEFAMKRVGGCEGGTCVSGRVCGSSD